MNAGRSELMRIGARTVETGIRKGPVERGHVGALGLAGDVVADVKNHGGPDQALYLYSSDDYAFWADELGATPEPGTFGENLTLSSFGAEPVRIGDRYRVGATLVEVTAPRIPCAVFATRMGEPDWVKRFADGHPHPTVVDLMDVWYDREPDPELLERLLASPLAERARANVENKLARVAS